MKRFIFLIFLFFNLLNINAQNAKVSIYVNGDDKEVSSQIESTIKEKLRNKNYIEFENQSPHFRLIISILSVEAEKEIAGMTISILLSEPSKLDKKADKILFTKMYNTNTGEKEISETCHKITSTLDVKYFEKKKKEIKIKK